MLRDKGSLIEEALHLIIYKALPLLWDKGSLVEGGVTPYYIVSLTFVVALLLIVHITLL